MATASVPVYEDSNSVLGMQSGRVLPDLMVESVTPLNIPVSPPPSPPEDAFDMEMHTSEMEQPPDVIGTRPMVVDDIDQVRELHEQWFPIRYQQVQCTMLVNA
jgi:hypothetical protein